MSTLALIELQHHTLAIPHHHIFAIERCSRSQRNVRLNGQQWELMDLDDDLQWHPGVDYAAPFVVCFRNSTLALRCARVGSTPVSNSVPLPRIMQGTNTLVEGFVPHPDRLVLIVNMSALLRAQSYAA